MRIVLQRVQRAGVVIEGKVHASIGKGFMVLLGIEEEDEPGDCAWLSAKVCSMRLFADAGGKMNLDLKQADGDLLVISQFTLHASAKKGNRPSFIKAARPEKAIPLYEQFIRESEQLLGKPCRTGVFGADMQVE